MPAFVLVHGTGVRQAAYEQMFAIARQRLARHLPNATLHPCPWGDKHGVQVHEAFSVPGDSLRSLDAAPAEPQLALWHLLLLDPLHEIRLLTPGRPGGFGDADDETEDLRSALLDFRPTAHVQSWLQRYEFEPLWPVARDAILKSPECLALLNAPLPPADQLRPAVARAFTAALFAEAIDRQMVTPCLEQQCELQAMLDACLGCPEEESTRALDFSTLAKPVLGIGRRIATWKLKRERVGLTKAVTPMLGDILYYQVRGQGIRDFVRASLPASTPVYVLAHSLGGIASVDLLASTVLPQVQGLVTFGSQAPFLYEMNALWSLSKGTPLPAHFPPWLNFYDLNDLLSYRASEVFHPSPRPVTDIELRSGQPDVAAHSAYLTQDLFWEELKKFVS